MSFETPNLAPEAEEAVENMDNVVEMTAEDKDPDVEIAEQEEQRMEAGNPDMKEAA